MHLQEINFASTAYGFPDGSDGKESTCNAGDVGPRGQPVPCKHSAGGASRLETRLRKAGGLKVGEDREAGAGPEIKLSSPALPQQ